MVHSSITSKEALDCFLATYRRIDCYEANATKLVSFGDVEIMFYK